jgi:hypothetical protein
MTGKRARTTLLVSHRKDRRDEESQAKRKCCGEWCCMHPCEQGSPSWEYELRYKAHLHLSCELLCGKRRKREEWSR